MIDIEHDVSLARLTTIGTGGPARALARPRTIAELGAALRIAAGDGLEVFVVGLGSNVLAADEGVEGLVLRLEGELAEVTVSERLLAAGGGATNAVCLHRARAAGLRPSCMPILWMMSAFFSTTISSGLRIGPVGDCTIRPISCTRLLAARNRAHATANVSSIASSAAVRISGGSEFMQWR